MQGMVHWWRKQALQKKILTVIYCLNAGRVIDAQPAGQSFTGAESTRAVQSEMQGGLEQTKLLAKQWLEAKKQQILALAHYLPAQSEDVKQWQTMLTTGREAGGYSLLYFRNQSGAVYSIKPGH